MICLDTTFVVGVLQGDATATAAYSMLVKEMADVMIPLPAVAELLTVADHARRNLWLKESKILHPTMDLASTMMAADLMRSFYANNKRPSIVEKEYMRTDAFILGIAIAQDARYVISRDKGMATLGQGKILVLTPSEVISQLTQAGAVESDQGNLEF